MIGKIFVKVLANSYANWAEEAGIFSEEQSAYRKGRSAVDNIFVLMATVQKYITQRKGRFYCVFIDFSWAFDTVQHKLLWYILTKKGVHGKILNVLKSMYAKLESCVLTPQGLTEYFECTVGTRQGCMISPLIFITFMAQLDELLKNSNCNGIYVDEFFSECNIFVFCR